MNLFVLYGHGVNRFVKKINRLSVNLYVYSYNRNPYSMMMTSACEKHRMLESEVNRFNWSTNTIVL